MPFPPRESKVASLIEDLPDERLLMTLLLRLVERARKEPRSGDFDLVEGLRSRESDLTGKIHNMNIRQTQ